jgi:hypothetical protein
MRLACVFVVIALGFAANLAVETTGPNAILFTFVGTPMLAVGVLLYVVERWRAGAFRAPTPEGGRKA